MLHVKYSAQCIVEKKHSINNSNVESAADNDDEYAMETEDNDWALNKLGFPKKPTHSRSEVN